MTYSIEKMHNFFKRQLSVYEDMPVMIKRKAMYLLSLNYIVLTMLLALMLIRRLMSEPASNVDIYLKIIIALLAIMLYLIIKGRMNFVLMFWAGIILQSVIFYYPTIPAGFDIAVTAEIMLIYSLWNLISYSSWHKLFGPTVVVIVIINRYLVNRYAFINGAIDINLMQMVVNAYIVVIAFLLLGIIHDFAVEHEIKLSQSNINEIKKNEEMSRRLSTLYMSNKSDPNQTPVSEYFDEMTGLLNRKAFNRLLGNYYEISMNEHHNIVLVYIDIDNLKVINDSYGHTYGDKYISAFSKSIMKISKERDISFRIGGDEFVLVYRDITSKEVEELLLSLRDEYISNCKLFLSDIVASFSYGFANTDEISWIELNELIDIADSRMYEMKGEKKQLEL